MQALRIFVVVTLAAIVGLGFAPTRSAPAAPAACVDQAAGKAAAEGGYTCDCDSPCSGSIRCANGCYAFCEENEKTGRHVCVKGCSEDALKAKGAVLDPAKKYPSVNLSMPRETARAVIERLYGSKPGAHAMAAETAASPPSSPVAIHLKNADLKAVLAELNK